MQQYYTVILNRKKLLAWIDARKKNGADISIRGVADQKRYGKSYLSRLMSWEKYGRIEVSARFIGTLMYTFGFQFKEIFDIVMVRDPEKDNHPQDRAKMFYQRVFKRQNGSRYYGA